MNEQASRSGLTNAPKKKSNGNMVKAKALQIWEGSMLIPEVSISHRIEESNPRNITTPPATFKILCARSSQSGSAICNLPFKSPVRCVANALQSKSLRCNGVQGHLPCKPRRCGLARHVLKCLSKLGSQRVLLYFELAECSIKDTQTHATCRA